MYLELHPDLTVHRVELGAEGAPLLIVDQFVADPDRLLRKAARSHFVPVGKMFPGIRARAPASYENLLAEFLTPRLQACFGIAPGSMTFPLCHYSLITRPPASLTFLQKIPHIDTAGGYGLATVHYLFKGDWGGTAFYRHRTTGYECIDDSRLDEYSRCLQQQESEKDAPTAGYIDGDTALFEQIARVDGTFNRLIVYRRNSLHSGSIDNGNVPPADPRGGRLSINTFIDITN
jgi:Family of unknown function (DUF6445)